MVIATWEMSRMSVYRKERRPSAAVWHGLCNATSMFLPSRLSTACVARSHSQGHDAWKGCDQSGAAGEEVKRHATGHRLQQRQRGRVDRNPDRALAPPRVFFIDGSTA